jgi:hypothetical protein
MLRSLASSCSYSHTQLYFCEESDHARRRRQIRRPAGQRESPNEAIGSHQLGFLSVRTRCSTILMFERATFELGVPVAA